MRQAGAAGQALSIRLWKVADLGKSLRSSQSPRPESRQWASAGVEFTLGGFVGYKRHAWVNANHSAWDVAEGRAESEEQCWPWEE